MSEYVDNVGLNQALTSVYNYISSCIGGDEISTPAIFKINNKYLDQTGLSYIGEKIKEYIDDNVPVTLTWGDTTSITSTGTYSTNLKISGGNCLGTITVVMAQYGTNTNCSNMYEWSFEFSTDYDSFITLTGTSHYPTVTLTIPTTGPNTYTIKYTVIESDYTAGSNEIGQYLTAYFTPTGSSNRTDNVIHEIDVNIK